MASTIKLKNGSGAPTTGDLVQGEPALDLTNKRLYTENASGVVIEVGTNPSTIDINAGTIDGTVIGGSTAAAGTFTTGQFNTSLNVDGTTNLDVVDIDGAVDMASTLTVGGTTNDGTTLAQIAQSGTGRAFSVNRNVASATRAVVNLAQLQASGGAEAVLDIQQTTPASRAIKVTPDGSIDRFSVYGTGALVTTPVAGGHAVFNEGGVDADFRVESDTNTHALFVEGSSGNVGIGTASPATALDVVGTVTADGLTVDGTAIVSDSTASVLRLLNTGTTGDGLIHFGDSDSNFSGVIQYNHDADYMALFTDTQERMRINASGQVGIGTSSPAVNLQVQKSASDTTIRLSDGTHYWDEKHDTAANGLSFSYDGSERLRITSTGNVGIGTSPSVKFHVSGQSRVADSSNAANYMTFGVGANAPYGNASISTTTAGLSIVAEGAGNMTFLNNGSERMRIDSSGNLLVGASSFSFTGSNDCVQISGTEGRINIENDTTSTAYVVAFYNTNGLVGRISTSGSATSYVTSSDERLKENITDANDAGDKIDAIKVRQYDWKADGLHQDYGMVAQELMTVAPEAVTGDPESDEMMGVDYSKLVPMMLKEIQSLRARVAQLEGAN
jgi:hypothetical protein